MTNTAIPLLLAVAYILIGCLAFKRLSLHATTPDEIDMVLSAELTVGGMIGKSLMIAIWPVWTVGAWMMFKLMNVFRAEAPTAAGLINTP